MISSDEHLVEPETNGYMLVDCHNNPVLEIGLSPTGSGSEVNLNLNLQQAGYRLLPAQVDTEENATEQSVLLLPIPQPHPDTNPQGVEAVNPTLFQPASTLPDLLQKVYFFNGCLCDIEAAWVKFNFVSLRSNTFGQASEADDQETFHIGGQLCDAAVNASRVRDAIFASPVFVHAQWAETRLTTAEPFLSQKGVDQLRFIERVPVQNAQGNTPK